PKSQISRENARRPLSSSGTHRTDGNPPSACDNQRMRPASAFLAAVLIAAPAFAQPWKNLDFLLGKWTGVAGEKDTPLGAGQGAFSFELQLDRKIIVRHNLARYDSGAAHDDLMVIYLDPPNDAPRAIYFDSEGH